MGKKQRKTYMKRLTRLSRLGPTAPLKVNMETGQATVAVVTHPVRERRKVNPRMAVVAAFAVKTSGKRFIKSLGKQLVVSIDPRTIHVLGKLVAAGAICYGRNKPALMMRQQSFLDAIANTPVDVKVNSSGEVTTNIGKSASEGRGSGDRKSPSPTGKGSRAQKKKNAAFEVGNLVSVSRDRGNNTIFHFDNLNYFIQVDFVNQLNLNPQQVINELQDELERVVAAIEQKVVEEKYKIQLKDPIIEKDEEQESDEEEDLVEEEVKEDDPEEEDEAVDDQNEEEDDDEEEESHM